MLVDPPPVQRCRQRVSLALAQRLPTTLEVHSKVFEFGEYHDVPTLDVVRLLGAEAALLLTLADQDAKFERRGAAQVGDAGLEMLPGAYRRRRRLDHPLAPLGQS